jgi:hypothetical protein
MRPWTGQAYLFAAIRVMGEEAEPAIPDAAISMITRVCRLLLS